MPAIEISKKMPSEWTPFCCVFCINVLLVGADFPRRMIKMGTKTESANFHAGAVAPAARPARTTTTLRYDRTGWVRRII